MKATYSFWLIFTLSVFTACAHPGDDDYPLRHGQVKPAEASPLGPVPPPPAPSPVPPVPLVTLPAPPAPKGQPPKPAAAASSSSPKGQGNTLQLSEPLSAPVKRLLNSAEESLKKGKILEARAQADRAYRMDLHDPRTSFMMARVSEREKAYEDAEQWAMRSLENLSDANNKRIVWAFVSRCREKNGNKKGRQEATRRVRDVKK